VRRGGARGAHRGNSPDGEVHMHTNERSIVAGVWRHILLAGLLVLPLLVLVVPRAASADAGEWRECVDDAFAEYNSCLMQSELRLSRMICDLSWELDVVLCTAERLGEIRAALNPE
jgi:hypothetical protein